MTHTEVRRRRLGLKMTQSKFGKMLGVTYQTVLRWENERVPVPGWMNFALPGLEAHMIAWLKSVKGGKK